MLGDMAKVAEEIVCYCSSCRMDLAHTIVAMNGDQIKRVHCKTCKKEHAYRTSKGLKEPGKKAKGERKSAAVPVGEEWQRLLLENKGKPQKTYNAKQPFQVGDRLMHHMFGEGVVGKLIYPNKMEVVFESDIKVLIHGPAPAQV